MFPPTPHLPIPKALARLWLLLWCCFSLAFGQTYPQPTVTLRVAPIYGQQGQPVSTLVVVNIRTPEGQQYPGQAPQSWVLSGPPGWPQQFWNRPVKDAFVFMQRPGLFPGVYWLKGNVAGYPVSVRATLTQPTQAKAPKYRKMVAAYQGNTLLIRVEPDPAVRFMIGILSTEDKQYGLYAYSQDGRFGYGPLPPEVLGQRLYIEVLAMNVQGLFAPSSNPLETLQVRSGVSRYFTLKELSGQRYKEVSCICK